MTLYFEKPINFNGNAPYWNGKIAHFNVILYLKFAIDFVLTVDSFANKHLCLRTASNSLSLM